MIGNYSCADFFIQNKLVKKSFRNTITVSNGLAPDPNCLQRLSADDKSRRVNEYIENAHSHMQGQIKKLS